MTKITSDFTGAENSGTRLSLLGQIHDFWWGTGAFATAATLGGVRTEMNTIAPDDTSNGEAFGSWLTKWNALNEPDKLLNDTLKDANPALFILADDTARIFGPDGVTAVSAPGDAVSLAADDWEGLELGSELVVNGGFDVDANWTKPTGVTITGGELVFTSVGTTLASQQVVSPVLTAGKAYLTEYEITEYTGGAVSLLNSIGGYGDTQRSSAGVYREIGVASGSEPGKSTIRLVARGTTTLKIGRISVREVLNWPAYQNTAAARPTWGRAPKEVRNLLTNSDLSGAVAGTPGTPPTGWTNHQTTGEIAAVAADGLLGGNSIQLTASGARRSFRQVMGTAFAANAVVRTSVLCEVISGTIPVRDLVGSVGPSGHVQTFEINGVSASATDNVPVGMNTVTSVCTVGATAGSVEAFWGLGVSNNATGTVRSWAPQGEVGTARSPYQRRGATPTDITESGVTSFGLISMDGSDDALLHQLAAGGTVSVALFGRGGSYLIPSITLAAPSVLQLGPLSVLDDGVLVSGCPTGILRAVGTVPWSSRFELVGYAIMKANPSAEEQARAMRYFAAFGARGWLVEGPELLVNGGFDTDTDWTKGSLTTIAAGKATMAASGASTALLQAVSLNQGTVYIGRWEVTDWTAGTAFLTIEGTGGPTYFGGGASGAGNRMGIAVGNVGAYQIRLLKNNAADAFSVDNISVKALTPEF
jgi:hypothetical protein